MRIHSSILAALALLSPCTGVLAADTAKQPFTVSDSIRMQRLVSPVAGMASMDRPRFEFSPDGKHFTFVTVRGNLDTGRNEYSLYVYDTDTVLRSVKTSGSAVPPPLTEFHMEAWQYYSSLDYAFAGAKWQDAKTLAFIGRDEADRRQVFEADITTGRMKQLTHHPDNVAKFDVAKAADVVAFATWSPPDWQARNEHGYTVGSDWMQDLGKDDPKKGTQEVRYFIEHLSDGRIVEMKLSPGIFPWTVSISPDGKWAVVFSQARGWPEHWRKYTGLRAAHENADTISEKDEDASAGAISPWLGEFALVDTHSGDMRSLLRAPAKAGGIVKVFWSSDSRSVVVSPSYLPLEGDDQETGRRSAQQAIVEVDIATGVAQRIIDGADLGKPSLSGIAAIERPEDDRLLLWTDAKQNSAPLSLIKKGSGWVRQGQVKKKQPKADHAPLELLIKQDLNTPPEVVARDIVSQKSKTLTDLNPAFRERTFGRAETFRWADKFGRSFTGGLVYPVSYQPGQRYPVVLQTTTSRFSDQIFLVDGFGWTTSAFAAQPFSNRNMVVLQMPGYDDAPRDRFAPVADENWWRDGEGARFALMMEGAIDALSDRGLIDRSRVGLIGFSRTGMHVAHALAFSKYPIAAATIADGMSTSPFGQTVFYGIPFPSGMSEFERSSFIGAPFMGEGIQHWMERSPFFHLDQFKAPLRFESFGLGVPSFWDSFAMLKHAGRPVELIHIPHAHHVLITPFSRYTSQQGNVDWFSYWLADYQDPDAQKAEQYRRWTRLRQHRDASDASQRASRLND